MNQGNCEVVWLNKITDIDEQLSKKWGNEKNKQEQPCPSLQYH